MAEKLWSIFTFSCPAGGDLEDGSLYSQYGTLPSPWLQREYSRRYMQITVLIHSILSVATYKTDARCLSSSQDTHRLKVKGQEKLFHVNSEQKRASIA